MANVNLYDYGLLIIIKVSFPDVKCNISIIHCQNIEYCGYVILMQEHEDLDLSLTMHVHVLYTM